MTEYELITARETILQSLTGISEVQASHIAIYLTLIFAYISVAYIAGSKLTRLQMILATAVFLLASTREVIAIALLGVAISEKYGQLEKFNASGDVVIESITLPSLFIWSSGIFISLIFMWSARHTKTE